MTSWVTDTFQNSLDLKESVPLNSYNSTDLTMGSFSGVQACDPAKTGSNSSGLGEDNHEGNDSKRVL